MLSSLGEGLLLSSFHRGGEEGEGKDKFIYYVIIIS